MKQIHIFLIAFLILIFSSSCEKRCVFCDTKFEGTVYDSLTGKAIPYAVVTLDKLSTCFGGGKTSDCWKYVDEDICNSKGKYKIKVNSSSDSMVLSAFKFNEYFTQEIGISSEEKQTVNFNLGPMAILRTHVNVNLDTSIRDYIWISPGKDILTNHYNSHMSFTGNIQSFYDIQLYANTTQKIKWTICYHSSDDYDLSFEDSIFCPAYETTDYYINY